MMAQYKVITSLSEPIEPLPAFDGSSSLNFVNFSLIYNPEDVSRPLESSQVSINSAFFSQKALCKQLVGWKKVV